MIYLMLLSFKVVFLFTDGHVAQEGKDDKNMKLRDSFSFMYLFLCVYL